jgi:PAB-dependent poly(A)-specific ribonuclease subunit 2
MASNNGHISFRDPATYRQEHLMQFHTGGVSSMDILGNYLITTGYSLRSSGLIADPLVKVFDLRMMKFMVPIPFPNGPSIAKFHPTMSSVVLAASQNGSMVLNELTDTSQIRAQFLSVNLSGYLTTVDVSVSGEMICIGDSFGAFQVLSTNVTPRINNISRPSQYMDSEILKSGDDFDDTLYSLSDLARCLRLGCLTIQNLCSHLGPTICCSQWESSQIEYQLRF